MVPATSEDTARELALPVFVTNELTVSLFAFISFPVMDENRILLSVAFIAKSELIVADEV